MEEPKEVKPILTGLTFLDKLTKDGLPKGELTVIAASRSENGIGKSYIMQKLLYDLEKEMEDGQV